MWLVLTAVATGVLSGLAVGGGSMLLLLLLLLFHLPQHTAQGAVLASFVLTAAVAAVTHWRQGNVRLRYVWWMAAGGLAGAWVGASLAAHLPGAALRRFYAFYLIGMGLVNLLGLAAHRAPGGAPAPGRPPVPGGAPVTLSGPPGPPENQR